MSRHKTHRLICRGVALALPLACAVVVWQLAFAQVNRVPLREVRQARASSGSLPVYDLALINADPTYYQRADASRLHHRAPVPPGQKRHSELQIIGSPFRLVLPYSWTEEPLVVRAKPGRPVTFVALDSGKFANGENTITLAADASGVAATPFYVTNQGYYRVLVASPENEGPAEFAFECVTKEFRDDVASGRYGRQYQARQRAAEQRRAQAAAEVAERIRRKRMAR